MEDWFERKKEVYMRENQRENWQGEKQGRMVF